MRAMDARPERCWSLEPDAIVRALDVTPARGLSTADAEARRARFGDNRLRQAQRRGAWSIAVAQFRSLIVLLLAVAAGVSFALDQVVEAVAILAVLLLNAALGFGTELRAVRSMEGLRALGHALATVRRGGTLLRVPAQALVPGDIVALEAGDVVSADLRLLQAAGLHADESTLTGESVPVAKHTDALLADAPLAERANMLFKGTAVTAGAGEAVVVGTGMETELGRISALVEGVDTADTPLEQRLEQLGRTLAWVSLAFVAAVVSVGLATGGELWLVLETGIALAVATVPEGLPIVATLALARGMWRMADRHALIEQLPAVETLGSTNVILTDKTGTLTENRMTVVRLSLPGGDALSVSGTGLALEGTFEREGVVCGPGDEPGLRALLRVAALCTDAELDLRDDGVRGVGDPMEVALLVAAHKAGQSQALLRKGAPELRQVAFEAGRKMMATFHRGLVADTGGSGPGGMFVAVKGAPEAVIGACSAQCGPDGERLALDDAAHRALREEVTRLGEAGLRVLAVATRPVDSTAAEPYDDLTLLGLVGLLDPPRTEVRSAVEACHRAGIRVVMVTGDHGGTAQAIARAVGLVRPGDDAAPLLGADIPAPDDMSPEAAGRLLSTPVIARCSPEQKLRLLSLYQARGFTVAMVGDGVNDAPALRQADIGVAMGLRGTQVAREAAAMVLQDDDFRTIEVAIGQGRVIYGNIRKFVIYLVSCNLSEILTIGVASLVGAPLPILPLQILFLNLVTDVFPALALGVGEGDSHVMERPPRPPGEPFLTRAHLVTIGAYGTLLAAAVLGGFAYAHHTLRLNDAQAVSVSFLVLSLAQLWHVFNMAAPGSSLWSNEITRNRWVWGALLLCVLLIGAGFVLPSLGRVLQLQNPGAHGLLAATGFSLLPLLLGRAWALLRGTAATT